MSYKGKKSHFQLSPESRKQQVCRFWDLMAILKPTEAVGGRLWPLQASEEPLELRGAELSWLLEILRGPQNMCISVSVGFLIFQSSQNRTTADNAGPLYIYKQICKKKILVWFYVFINGICLISCSAVFKLACSLYRKAQYKFHKHKLNSSLHVAPFKCYSSDVTKNAFIAVVANLLARQKFGKCLTLPACQTQTKEETIL